MGGRPRGAEEDPRAWCRVEEVAQAEEEDRRLEAEVVREEEAVEVAHLRKEKKR